MQDRLKIWAILALTLTAAIVYAVSGSNELTVNGFKFKKLDLSQLMRDTTTDAGVPDSDASVSRVDSSRQTFLFFGDSMTSGLFYRLDEYCQANGHKLYSITWFSATTQSFAESNLLDTYIQRYHPTFFIICLGSNELFVRDLADRKQYISGILRKIGHKPYVWISPPNWKKDTGMDSTILAAVGRKRFFDSSALTLERSNDHIHPTISASYTWMDCVAQWMGTAGETAHPIVMHRPEKKYRHTFTDYYQTTFSGFTGTDNPERHRRYFK